LGKPNIANLFNPKGVTFFKKWNASLSIHPIMLHSEIGLECITKFLRRTNSSLAKEIGKAINALFVVQEREEGESPPHFIPPVNARQVMPQFSEESEAVNRRYVFEPSRPAHNSNLTWRKWFRTKVGIGQ